MCLNCLACSNGIMHVHETRLHSISSIIITSTGIDILNMYSPVDLIQYVLYQIHHVYSIVNIYLLLFYAQSCPFPLPPPLSLSLLYHDNFRIACRFIYIYFCYLTTSSYCCINCEYFIFYTCLARARYYIYHYLPYFDHG